MSNRQRTSEIARDVVVFVTGAVLVGSTVWLPVQGDQEVTGAILVLGILAASTALWAIGSSSRQSHWTHVGLGLLLAASPALMVFPSGLLAADLFAIIGGLVIAAMGALGVLASRRAPVDSQVVASSGDRTGIRV
ncbi:MAG: SPW repeat domain-containing protein [Rhodococcus sp. (in: high G+C Gram-positive bacteria)]